MQSGRRYTLFHTLHWTSKSILIFALLGTVPVVLREYAGLTELRIPWVPIALIGTAVAFYLGFKNNSSYERLWEARKIWGGIVNTSRAWAVAARDFVTAREAAAPVSEDQLHATHCQLILSHIAWVHALTLQMREQREWEHTGSKTNAIRKTLGTLVTAQSYERLRPLLGDEVFERVRAKKNTAVHILGQQSQTLRELRERGWIEDFRHMELQALITEMYALQGKSERIKNFPFPRQYATVNLFFVWLFILLLPFGMVDLFNAMGTGFIWLTIPFTTIVAWVFHTMEMIGDYSENPFEGTYNDVPISAIAVGIEIDLRELIDDTELPTVPAPIGPMRISV